MTKKAEKLTRQRETAPAETGVARQKCWLKADYHFHVFHYRMPDTVAIASVTPFVPSPLTVKMALIAALLQNGDEKLAQQLAPQLPQVKVYILPPASAFSFKAFLRYRSVPAVEAAVALDESGSYYPSRPHMREYALFEDTLTIFLGLPDSNLLDTVKRALRNIRYLGCKDSIVTCLDVQEVPQNTLPGDKVVQPLSSNRSGSVILGADFINSVEPDLKDLIPGSRKEEHYHRHPPLFTLPGRIIVKGRTRIFKRDG